MKKLSGISKLSSKIAVMAILSMSILAAACNSKKASKELPVLKLTKTIKPTPVLDLVDIDGLAVKHGVMPKIETSNDLESVILGKNDAKLTHLIKPLISAAGGADLVIFAGSMTNGHILYANKDAAAQIHELKDLKGHSIAMEQDNTGYFLIPNALKKRFGYTQDDVEIRLMFDEEAAISAVAKGEADVTNMPYSMARVADSYGLVKIADLADLAPDYACCRQTANGPKFRKDRDQFVAWTKGIIEAYKVYKTDKEHTIAVMTKKTGEDRQWVIDNYYDPKYNAQWSAHPDPNYNGVRIQYDRCVEQGFVENPRPIEDFFDISVYADALREIIKENPNDEFYKAMWPYFVSHNSEYPGFAEKYPETL